MIQERKEIDQELQEALEGKFPGAVLESHRGKGDFYLTVDPGLLPDLCRFLREEPWQFDFLAFISGVDWLGRTPRFEVVYHLRSLPNNYRLGLKVSVSEEACSVPSVADIWKTADWMEREVYDLYGVVFTGHPNLKRIMMPDDWEGHPYRKDYPLEGA